MGTKAVCCLLPGEPDNEGLNPALPEFTIRDVGSVAN